MKLDHVAYVVRPGLHFVHRRLQLSWEFLSIIGRSRPVAATRGGGGVEKEGGSGTSGGIEPSFHGESGVVEAIDGRW